MQILLVEDNKGIRDSLIDALSHGPYQIMGCENGKRALEIVNKNPIDVVISDIMMPVMDGHELLKRIKENPELSYIEVVLFTGYGDVRSAVEAMRHGAYDFILKPVNVQELDAVLKRLAELVYLKKDHEQLSRHFQEEVRKATREMENELVAIKKAFAREVGTVEMGIFSKPMKELFKHAEKLHQHPEIPVLIEGETGTGKELIAHFIHFGRGDQVSPFIGLNCAALSTQLFESELFGYEAGAFTGGNPKGQIGKLELAGNGSLFLDEITEMPNEHQAKLLRVIQEREFYRVGGLKRIEACARFICATNQNIKDAIKAGRFRQDLYFRLNTGYIRIPPLRERPESILPMALLFLRQLSTQRTTRFRQIGREASQMLEEYHWPGNVRELKNLIERIILYWDDEEIQPGHIQSCLENIPSLHHPQKITGTPEDFRLPKTGFDLNRHTLQLIQTALNMHSGNQTRTAKYLGISVRVLHTYLKKL
jgi:two-component system response regulator AtoC